MKNFETEILVTSPDKETWDSALKAAKESHFSSIRWIKDDLKGKPAALNLAIKAAKGDILILTDGDTRGYSNKAVSNILRHFKDKKVGGVTGNPRPINKRDNLLGYWSHLHCYAADIHRKALNKKGSYFPLSGYLYAIKRPSFQVPAQLLAEDAWISTKIFYEGYRLVYEPLSKVYIKFPTTFSDWFKQKSRSLGGNIQISRLLERNTKVKRSMTQDVGFILLPISFSKNLRELLWSFLLYPFRLALWIRIFYEQYIINREILDKPWERIETTK